MKIYCPDDCKKYIEKIDEHGDSFKFMNRVDNGVHSNGYPLTKELVEEILLDIKFPIDKINTDIFLLPFRLMIYDKGWTGLEYNGRAYDTHVVYGARPEKPNKENTVDLIVHELGHVLMYKYLGDNLDDDFSEGFKEYMEIRGIKGIKNHNENGGLELWHKRPVEIFAEDFRYFFSPDYDKEDFITNWNGNPSKEVRKFMVNLVESNINFNDIEGHWAEKDIIEMVKMGLLKGYDDGSFKPDNPITRAEISVILNRLVNKKN